MMRQANLGYGSADRALRGVAAARPGWQLRAEEERLLAELAKVSEEQGELQHVAAELDAEAREVRELEEQYARRRLGMYWRGGGGGGG